MDGKSGLTLVTQPDVFFYELIADAFKNQQVRAKPETEVYLVNLLRQFMTTESLYARESDGTLKEESLVSMLKEAVEQPEPESKKLLFRHAGDFSLYVAGYFQDSLAHKLVDVDYYIGMGEKAYRNVAAVVTESTMRSLFQELASKFSAFVEVLAEVSEKTTQKTDKNLLRLYELWMSTGSERAARQLQEAGIIPNETINKKLQ